MSTPTALLQLARLGIGHGIDRAFDDFEWNNIQVLATKQGLSAVVIDGVELLPESKRPSKELLLQWIGDTLQNYEYRYELYKRAIAELAGWYNAHGYKMMVLKGYACSLDWPKPEHRPCGDIDIWLFGKQKEADELLSKENGAKIDSSHHHHTVFNWRDFMVENHYDFVNIYDFKSSKKIEGILKDLGSDDTNSVDVYGEKVYIPSVYLHALFLAKHMVSHFASEYITIRQILDWAFFVEKHTKEINWSWLKRLLDVYHMSDFFNCINAICVEDLGFVSDIFPVVQFEPNLKERVLNDILSPEFNEEEPKWLIPRLIFKYRRWKANAWKQNLCYKESRWSIFWRGIWYHMLKPTSI